jgi:glycosyltransferase involved in cell wall biosynthesis
VTLSIAIVSTTLPPTPNGQARVLEALLRDAPASVLLLSQEPHAELSGAHEFGRVVQLEPHRELYTLKRWTQKSKSRLNNLGVHLNNLAGLMRSVFERGREIEGAARAAGVEVIVGCTASPFDLPAAYLAARSMKVPFIGYLFDDPVHQWPKNTAAVYRTIAQLWEPVWSKGAAALIAPNEILARDIEARRRVRVRIIRNPVPSVAFDRLETGPSPAGPRRIVYTGTVYHAQGDAFRNLVEALSAFGGRYELHVYTGQPQAALEAQGVSGPYVIRHDNLSGPAVHVVQQSADILFLPLSFTEIQEVIRSSSPGKTGEYLASGRPILVHAPEVTWISTFLAKYEAALVVTKKDPALLEAAIRRLENEPEHGRSLARAAKALSFDFHVERTRLEFWGLARELVRDIGPEHRSTVVNPVVQRRRALARRPKILFVAMHTSPHTARWIELISGLGWDLHMFPVFPGEPNANLSGVTVHIPQLAPVLSHKEIRVLERRWPRPPVTVAPVTARFRDIGEAGILSGRVPLGESDQTAPSLYSPGVLARLIEDLQPDFIHSMEFQHSGYLTLAAKERVAGPFPRWLATNWGSDIYHFQQFEDHRRQVTRLLGNIDYYSCECHRDIRLAQDLGYAGPVLPVLTNTGGFDLEHISQFKSPTPPSQRRRIMVKGYQHFAGRAMTSLAVLESLAEELRDYEIVLYSISSEPLARAHELNAAGTLNIHIVGWADHDQMLGYFGSSRMYIGTSVSDAISTSVLEAMAMGAFPIQTNTSCCDEWFDDGVGGFITDPHDPALIRDRVLRALSDDALVDRAAIINARTVAERLDERILAPKVRDFYEPILLDLEADAGSAAA